MPNLSSLLEGSAAAYPDRTAVVLGGTRLTYVGLLAVAFAVVAAVGFEHPWTLMALLGTPFAVPPARTVLGGGRGPALIGALQATGLLTLITGILLAAGLALST